MEQYKLSNKLGNDKVFIVQKSEVEGRLEAEYYKPNIAELDKKIRSLTNLKLRDFIERISSGATPSKSEEEKYYSDEENGIPFLRVQNLQTNGRLSLDSVKYINMDTHNGMLKRSQVSEYDLLVKITGVGRMAIASVAPEGFTGNTNQHMVVIKTNNKVTSEYLAKYLNLDLVEKLASRRATGATRPALDYPALKSIPIIENIDFSKIEIAEKLKIKKDQKANEILNRIDDYILTELGINLIKEDNSLSNRIFQTSFRDVNGSRLDPKLYDNNTKAIRNAIIQSSYKTVKLRTLITQSIAGDWGKEESEEQSENRQKCLVIRATEFDNDFNLKLDNSRVKYRLINKDKLKKIDIQNKDLLIEKSGGSPDQPVGRISIITDDIINEHQICYSNFIHKIRVDTSLIDPEYLFSFLKTVHNIKLTEAMQSQTNGIRNLIMSNYFDQQIPLPEIDVQREIAEKANSMRNNAKQLQLQAINVLLEAQKEVEQTILE